MASSFPGSYLQVSTPLIKKGFMKVSCCSKAEREEARIKSEFGTMYTKCRKQTRKGNLPEAVKICEKKMEDLGFTISSNDWKTMLEKSEGGFIGDVYRKYAESKETKGKTTVMGEKKVEIPETKNKKKK